MALVKHFIKDKLGHKPRWTSDQFLHKLVDEIHANRTCSSVYREMTGGIGYCALPPEQTPLHYSYEQFVCFSFTRNSKL